MDFLASAAPEMVTFHPPTAHEWVAIAWTWIAMVIIVVLASRTGFASGQRGRISGLFEMIYEFVDDLAQGAMGSMGRAYIPFAMTAFLLILTSNWLGLLPLGAFQGDFSKEGPVLFTGLVAEKPAHEAAPAAPLASPAAASLPGQTASPVGGETPAAVPGLATTQAAPAEGVHTEAAHAEAAHEEGHHGPVGLAESPSANLNMTLSLAVTVFFAVWIYGYLAYLNGPSHGHDHGHDADHGHGNNPVSAFFAWLGHYVQPVPMLWASMEAPLKYFIVPLLCPLFIVLNIVDEVAHVISLTLRLFGNIGGEHQVKLSLFAVMFGMLAQVLDFTSMAASAGQGVLFLLLWAVSIGVTILGTLVGFIQAMVFTMLTLAYIGHAVHTEH